MRRNPLLDGLATALGFVLLCIAVVALYRVSTVEPFHCHGSTGIFTSWYGSQQVAPQDPACVDPRHPYGPLPSDPTSTN